jgi:glycosyltransferase involved in cell wall biosynthesis
MSVEKPIFSVGLIVKNEEHTLPKLYECLKDFINDGGEVVILDTGSTDNTVHIAQEYGMKTHIASRSFIDHLSAKNVKIIKKTYISEEEHVLACEWIKEDHTFFNFGKARNELHKYITNDVVIQLDGSDILSAFDYKYINEKIKEGVHRFDYRQIYGPVELTISRFYNKNVDVWEGRIHEILTHKMNVPILSLPKDKLTVVHNFQEKKRTYLSGLFADLLDNPNHTRTLYYLGRELMFVGWFQSSIKMLERYVNRPDCWVPERSSAYCLIGSCYENLGSNYYNDAFNAYNLGFVSFNGWREPLLKAARLCQRTDEFQRGLCYAIASLSINRISEFAEPVCNYRGLPHEIIYWGYYFTGRHKEASSHWKIAFTLEPNHEKYLHDKQFFDKSELFDDLLIKHYLRIS